MSRGRPDLESLQLAGSPQAIAQVAGRTSPGAPLKNEAKNGPDLLDGYPGAQTMPKYRINKTMHQPQPAASNGLRWPPSREPFGSHRGSHCWLELSPMCRTRLSMTTLAWWGETRRIMSGVSGKTGDVTLSDRVLPIPFTSALGLFTVAPLVRLVLACPTKLWRESGLLDACEGVPTGTSSLARRALPLVELKPFPGLGQPPGGTWVTEPPINFIDAIFGHSLGPGVSTRAGRRSSPQFFRGAPGLILPITRAIACFVHWNMFVWLA
jgi:hypothetical protein